MFLDETQSIGCLGSSGRGVTEFWNVPISMVDIVMGSMSHCLAAGGGFSAGSIQVVDHQRLSSQAYCFSASLPAILTTTAIHVLDLLRDPASQYILNLKRNLDLFNSMIKTKKSNNFELLGHDDSPLKYLVSYQQDALSSLNKNIIEEALYTGLLLSIANGICNSANTPVIGIKLMISAGYTSEETKKLASFINLSINRP